MIEIENRGGFDGSDHGSEERELSISVETLLFGAIALNLVGLACLAVIIGIVWIIIYNHPLPTESQLIFSFKVGQVTPPYYLNLFITNIFFIVILVTIVRLSVWAAKGFLERRAVPIGATALFFIFYGLSASASGMVDGYVALGTVALTAITVIITRYGHVASTIAAYVKK